MAMYRYFAAVCLALLAWPAAASMILVSPVPFSGTGIGSVNTLLTIQGSPVEQGCVSFGWVIGAEFDGSGACIGSADDVKTGASQTQTRTLNDIGNPSAADFRIVLNAAEPAGNSIKLDNLSVAFYSSAGSLLYLTSGVSCPGVPDCLFPETFTGTGNAGFVFRLSDDQAAGATAAGAFSSGDNVIGMSARLSLSGGANETFFAINVGQAGGEIPEPSSVLLFGTGLIAMSWIVRKRRLARK